MPIQPGKTMAKRKRSEHYVNNKEFLAALIRYKEDRTMLIVHTPVTVSEIKNKTGLLGYKVEPWLKTTRDDMFIINMDRIITLTESSDMEMIVMYQHYLRDAQREYHNQHRLNRRMGYISNVRDAKENLEKLFKLDSPKDT